MSKKTGRPAKASTAEKIAIVDSFFVSECAESTAIRSHGVYTRIAKFAMERGFPDLRPYDFSKDAAVVEHLHGLQSSSVDTSASDSAMPVYEPMDISSLAKLPLPKMVDALRSRDEYYKNVCVRAGRAISGYAGIAAQAEALRTQLSESRQEIELLKQQCDDISATNKKLQEEVSYWRKIAQQEIAPARDEEYLVRLGKEGTVSIAEQVIYRNPAPKTDPVLRLFGGDSQ